MSSAGNTHNQFLAHHFDSMVQQREAITLGMWIFLLTEIMFFGAIFIGYGVYRYLYPDMFLEMSKHLDITMGTVNTAVLLTSSLTMALAVNAAQTGKQKRLFGMLTVTFLCACGFLVIKFFEYKAKFEHGLVPGALWHYHGGAHGDAHGAAAAVVGHGAQAAAGHAAAAPAAHELAHRIVSQAEHTEQLFMSFYFGCTGLHGLHVLIGVGLILWFMVRTKKGHFPAENYQPVEVLGLYWHFVDLVWIFVFPLFYLVGRT